MPTTINKKENDNIEFKESWNDSHLKAICAFANTKGGTLLIGVDDKGAVKGLADAKKLLEDIPSKAREWLGLTPDVQLKKSKGKEYIEVKIKEINSPISLRGKYYVRSGSTNQELRNNELQSFLLAKSNTSWEAILEESDISQELSSDTIEFFKTRAESKQLPAAKEKDTEQLLNKLHLASKGRIMRAGILLFAKDPQSHFPGAFIRIGKFSDTEVPQTSEEIRGNLFEQAEQAISILKTKYLVSQVRIDGLYRNENLEYPESALREALVNAIAHKDYSGPHIQIKVYNDKLTFWNPGELPKDLTIDSLKKSHSSFPRNQKIARVFYDSGLIEAWGSGTMKMIKDCMDAGLPEPMFEERNGGILVTFSKDIFTEQLLLQKGLNDRQLLIVNHLKNYGSINNAKYQELTQTAKRTATRDLAELVEKHVIEKFGSTGKGTMYRLKGQPSTNASASNTTTPANELDKKLHLLDKALEIFDPDEEIKVQFSKEVFVQLFDGWITDLLQEIVPVIQKFNRYFVNPGHFINLPSGTGYVKFSDDDALSLIKDLKDQFAKNTREFQHEDKLLRISTFYGSFRKAGLETFGANYSIQVKFDLNWYEVTMDEEVMKRTEVQQFKRQYHKPLTRSEAKGLAERFGDLIFRHINTMIENINSKKGKTGSKDQKQT
jgi:ATP-dependent DNA helicase RecG